VLYTTTVTVGLLWFSQLREVLDDLAWRYKDFTYKEGRGWLDRTFYIKGPYEPVKCVADQMDGWSTRIREQK
jgi:hypothetical protein